MPIIIGETDFSNPSIKGELPSPESSMGQYYIIKNEKTSKYNIQYSKK